MSLGPNGAEPSNTTLLRLLAPGRRHLQLGLKRQAQKLIGYRHSQLPEMTVEGCLRRPCDYSQTDIGASTAAWTSGAWDAGIINPGASSAARPRWPNPV